MRLDKYIANSSDFSRNQVKLAIKKKSVTVDGLIATTASLHVNDEAEVSINGAILRQPHLRYFMLHKPHDYVCATKDNKHATVLDLLVDEHNLNKLHIAGRLDIDTTGLVLITDDGKWTHNVISPNKKCDKRYYVETLQAISDDTFTHFQHGIMLSGENKRCKPANLELIEVNSGILTIHEGKFHQVKRMFEAVDNQVTALHRLSVGDIHLDDSLEQGEYRPLTQAEIASI